MCIVLVFDLDHTLAVYDHATEYTPRPGALEFLEKRFDDGHELHVRTHAVQDFAEKHLENLGMLRFFKSVKGRPGNDAQPGLKSLDDNFISRDATVIIIDDQINFDGKQKDTYLKDDSLFNTLQDKLNKGPALQQAMPNADRAYIQDQNTYINALIERDMERDAQLGELKACLAEQEARLAECDAQIGDLKASLAKRAEEKKSFNKQLENAKTRANKEIKQAKKDSAMLAADSAVLTTSMCTSLDAQRNALDAHDAKRQRGALASAFVVV
ncbi:hypothetical protein T492DRAFT_861622 [Pavlovales sp. CCMP2436]|nr:hypothetical protein T492DRAFT_861622 [Pavlovales sp. CCMP2436]